MIPFIFSSMLALSTLAKERTGQLSLGICHFPPSQGNLSAAASSAEAVCHCDLWEEWTVFKIPFAQFPLSFRLWPKMLPEKVPFCFFSDVFVFHCSHGNKEAFSCRGIRLAVDWFRDRGHTYIKVFVPSWRKEPSRSDTPIRGMPHTVLWQCHPLWWSTTCLMLV